MLESTFLEDWDEIGTKIAKKGQLLPKSGINSELLSIQRVKALQVKCFEYLLKGKDIVAVQPTGFGKFLLLMCEHISNLQRLFNTQISIRVTRQVSRELTPHNVLLTKT